jgi:hypothetical protein
MKSIGRFPRFLIAGVAVALVAAALAGTKFGSKPVAAQTAAGAESIVTYDSFSGEFINPAKWLAFSPCSTNTYDCVREQREGVLRLGLRAYGASTSDTGVSFSNSGLQFRNPGLIKLIQVKATINSFSSAACPANSEAAHPQFLVNGTFFNAGSGGPQDDVQAYIMIERRTDDPTLPSTTLRVGAFMSVGSTFFNNVDLGTVQTGEDATLTLTWDRGNKAFVAQIVRTETNPLLQVQTMPYSQPDSLPPAIPFKSIQVGTFTPNCMANVTFAAMKARIGVVKVNAAP